MPTFHFSSEGKVVKTSSSDSGENMEDMEGLLPGEDKEATMGEAVPRAPRRVKWIPSIFCVGLFMLLVGFIITVVNIAHMARADDFCFKRSTFYSPVTKDINTHLHLVRNNGTLDWPSIYRGPPSPELDAAWSHIAYDMGVVGVPEEEALKAGLRKGDVRIPPGYKNSGYYMASLEVTHQLHCVNFLRKAAWLNYPYYKDKGWEFSDPPDELERHLYHCIEILRQMLMCNADPGLIGYRWVRGREGHPYPYMNTPHKCRDFQGMLDWAYENMVSEDADKMVYSPGPDEVVWDHDPSYVDGHDPI
ncbi:hypothetical protein VTN96DRAFT_6777 [Rasamsonia emersonii]